ncbi:hypothetical protein [Streptomyces rugosispiralis]|uniref:Uncharacterized protein n=1 Tax=Streptomyces rugosispiralis TaxID=2967341 RepID=A0ABT1V971_9ACTN|nr:hypothetical protein [Streptomyces rugosispiralis]MCQ8193943.1 hypothetical protein [Streptomyces rugosispiralis]
MSDGLTPLNFADPWIRRAFEVVPGHQFIPDTVWMVVDGMYQPVRLEEVPVLWAVPDGREARPARWSVGGRVLVHGRVSVVDGRVFDRLVVPRQAVANDHRRPRGGRRRLLVEDVLEESRHRAGCTPDTPYGHPLVERGPLGGLQVRRAEEAGDLAQHVEGDRQFRGRGLFLLDGGVVGQEVGDGRADGAAADAVDAGEVGDRAALQVGGADRVGLRRRDGWAVPALDALGFGSVSAIVGELALELVGDRSLRVDLPQRFAGLGQ